MEEMFAEENMKEDVMLPGFRFHPTDEELVGFYLRRKVGRKPICFELIRDVDIYKHDPWDLPKMSSVGDKEWYFFCIRGRKYKNSVRPNRVTESGFWKATGIDKSIYSSGQTHHECIGLKKSLVFYRGAAGKGTKTDWMMHEFRLPPSSNKTTNQPNPKNISYEAEVWTLCRIFKKIEPYKRYKSDWKNMTTLRTERFADNAMSASYKSSSSESENSNLQQKIMLQEMNMNPKFQYFQASEQTSAVQSTSYSSSNMKLWDQNSDEFLKGVGKWDELGSVLDLASDTSNIYHSISS